MTTYLNPGLGCSCKRPCPVDAGPTTCICSDKFDAMPDDLRGAIMQVYRAARDGRKLTSYEVGTVVRTVVNQPHPHCWCPYDGCGGDDGDHPLLTHFNEWLFGNC